MQITVKKLDETPNSTLSKLLVDGKFFCFILEDGHREKKVKHHTRIPDGTYRIGQRRTGTFYQRYKKQHGHKFVPHLLDVPGFEYILMHKGNTVADTSGCLIVCDAVGFDRVQEVYYGIAGSSSPAYLRLYEGLRGLFEAGQEVTIQLHRDEPNVELPVRPPMATAAPMTLPVVGVLLFLLLALAPALRAQTFTIDSISHGTFIHSGSASIYQPKIDTTHGIVLLSPDWQKGELTSVPAFAVGRYGGYERIYVDSLVCSTRPLRPGESRCRHEWRAVDRQKVAWFYRKPDNE